MSARAVVLEDRNDEQAPSRPPRLARNHLNRALMKPGHPDIIAQPCEDGVR